MISYALLAAYTQKLINLGHVPSMNLMIHWS